MERKIIENLKSLGIDMINEAGSGHPGIVLSSAPIIYTIYAEHMNINIKDSQWINRDRFVMSAGHGSALLYSVLYMCGFLEMDDLKGFRKLNSRTPGHPEFGVTPGVDISTGPLGQGIASAVGMAIGEKHLQSKLGTTLIDNYIYVLCGDGDLMEGISYEAASLAGTLNLNNLIVLYDSNKISLDGEIKHTFTEDVLERFDAMGWYATSVGNKPSEINKAIIKAKRSGLPSLIEVKTVIGDGSVLQGTNLVHGKPLTTEDIKQLKEKLNVNETPFYVDENLRKFFQNKIVKRSSDKYIKWQKEYKNFINDKLDGKEEKIKKFMDRMIDFSFDNIPFDICEYEEIRESNRKIMNFLSSKTDLLFGGSADLSVSCKTYLADDGDFSNYNYSGKNIWYGVREHAMGAISNGIATVGYLPFCSTFLTFSDYLKPAIRMSALMNLPVTYIFTHDSINVGADGPTHQPIEQIAGLRNIPNMTVYRPADFNEVAGTWKSILKLKKPSAIVLSKEKVYNYNNTKACEVINGAYILKKEKQEIDAILVATGSEVETAINVANELEKEGYDIRVVSMPSVNLFLQTKKSYQYNILPVGKKIFFIEAASSYGLRRFVTNDKYLITLNEFGKSADADELLQEYKFDEENIKQKIRDLL